MSDIKAGNSYKVKFHGKIVTARVTHVQPKGRGHTIHYAVRGQGGWHCSAADFRKAIV